MLTERKPMCCTVYAIARSNQSLILHKTSYEPRRLVFAFPEWTLASREPSDIAGDVTDDSRQRVKNR